MHWSMKTYRVGERYVRLALADTWWKRALGLRFRARESWEHCDGMRFEFPCAWRWTFSMRGVRMPLTLLGLDSAGQPLFSARLTPQHAPYHYRLPQPVQTVIELFDDVAVEHPVAARHNSVARG